MTVPIPVELRSLNMAELAYPDIQAYLKVCDLVLVPIASTEQHGPHLPLCTDNTGLGRRIKAASPLANTIGTALANGSADPAISRPRKPSTGTRSRSSDRG